MKTLNKYKQYIFTMIFGLLLISTYAEKPETSYYTAVWDGQLIQINNPQAVKKKKFCIKKIYINGKKVKTQYKTGGIEFDPSAYGFKEGDELLLQVDANKDCLITFHSKGFVLQKD